MELFRSLRSIETLLHSESCSLSCSKLTPLTPLVESGGVRAQPVSDEARGLAVPSHQFSKQFQCTTSVTLLRDHSPTTSPS